ncbi:hypothetical protein [Enterocloster citroniae]|uniref:hypothetical protein n=1 Tax=Enterocloster citroniae TaxID=358743 RepID=UPI00349E8EBA
MELKKLKGLLGIPEGDTAQDIALQFLMDDVDETIRNYCNLKAVPAGLASTSYRMAMDLYRYEHPGDANALVQVSSISEGDTSTSFTSAADALTGGILKDYQGQLNRYRKLVW